jgi:hypothetical protein
MRAFSSQPALTGEGGEVTIPRVKIWPLLVCFGGSVVAAAACGARSELPVPRPHHAEDAGPDAEPDVVDAPPDVPPDVPPPPDDCADAGVTFVYLMTSQNHLLRFYPPDLPGGFVDLGLIDCPAQSGATPFSMAVDRTGAAYVVFSPSGELFKLSTLTLDCQPTGFVQNQEMFPTTFGMGFSSNPTDPGETLFVAGDYSATPGQGEPLATIDPKTFTLSTVGDFSKVIGNAELTGTGAAQLFAFGIETANNMTIGLHLAEIDKTNAAVIDDKFLALSSGTAQITAWAFAFWGGDFYFFTSASGEMSSSVSRYHQGDPVTMQPLPVVATVSELNIVGAGVSTCAPQQ